MTESMGPFRGWSSAARNLVEVAAQRHGGWDLHGRLRSMHLELEDFGGPLPRAKGCGTRWPAPRHVVVEPHARRTTFVDWPSPGCFGLYEEGGVRLCSLDGRDVLRSPAHRSRVPWFAWRAEDALYFFGYALVTYMSLPFVLASTQLVNADSRSVTVEFPPGLDTHSRRQRFFFDDTGLLVRHDYTADVVGPWATGAHFTAGYVDAGGLAVATQRHVLARMGSFVTPLPVLAARISGVRAVYAD